MRTKTRRKRLRPLKKLESLSERWPDLSPAYLVFASLIACFALAMVVWIALRLPLWGDELDTFGTAFRPWRGHKNFWWHVGQFNACPPGDPLVLRLLYRSNVLPWLREMSPELFWRIPHISAFCLTMLAAGAGAWRWTGSRFIALFAVLWIATAPGALLYAVEARFYIWLVFFTAAALWEMFLLAEKPESKRFYAVSILITLGLCFHLMLAAAGYFFLLYTLFLLGMEAWNKRGRVNPAHVLVRLFFGALPFIAYKVELKHFIFIPPPIPGSSPWQRLWESNIVNTFGGAISTNLPSIFFNLSYIYWLPPLVAGAVVFAAVKRNIPRVIQGGFLLMLLIAAPIALFTSAAARDYGLMGRHFVFSVPVIFASIAYLWMCLRDVLAARAAPYVTRFRAPLQLAGLAIAAVTCWNAVIWISDFAYSRRYSAPSKIVYQFLDWRNAYRGLPDRRELVIVGTRPDQYSPLTDLGSFRAGMMQFYTKEFRPSFLSLKGAYNSDEALAPALEAKFEAQPQRYDFLLMDDPARLRMMFPKLPWTRWKCISYTGEQALNFCRL